MTLAIAAALVALLLGAAGEAAGQENDPRSTATTRVGPLYLTPTITLEDLGFDSNVFNSPAEGDSDFTLTVAPQIDAAIGIRRALLTLRSITDFSFFATHDGERSVNQDLQGGARWSFNRLTLYAGASYLNTRRRPNEEIDARSRRIEEAGELGARLAIFSRIAADVAAGVSRSRFDADAVFDNTRLFETLDRDRRTLRASIRYALTPLTALVMLAEVTEERFVRSPERDADSTLGAVALEFDPAGLISGAARIGYQRFRPQSSALPDFSGVTGSVDVAYRFRESTRISGGLDRAIGYSYSELQPYYVQEGFSIAFRRQLRARFDVEVGTRRLWYRYRRIGPGVTGMGARIDTLRNDSVTFGYSLSRDVRSTVTAAYRKRRSNELDRRNYDGLRVGSSIVYRF